jgi:hypothetical protein
MLYAQQSLLLIHRVSDERCTRAALIYVYRDDRSTRSYCVHRVWMSGNVSAGQRELGEHRSDSDAEHGEGSSQALSLSLWLELEGVLSWPKWGNWPHDAIASRLLARLLFIFSSSSFPSLHPSAALLAGIDSSPSQIIPSPSQTALSLVDVPDSDVPFAVPSPLGLAGHRHAQKNGSYQRCGPDADHRRA